MTKDYEGKLGIGQLILCLFAAATLVIPYTFEPMVFSFNNIMPIGDSVITATQNTYISAFLETLGLSAVIPEAIFNIIPYTIYAFYGIIAFDILFTIILMIFRVEIFRIIVRALSILLGFATLAVFLVSLVTTAGFFTYYLSGGFGEGAVIIDCIKNNGLLFFLGVTVFSIIVTVKQFSSFFGKSY